MDNIDEMHIIINLDNGKTFGLFGAQEGKYTDIMSGVQGITMLVRPAGGLNSKIMSAFLIFQNANRSYSIRRISDDIPGVCYRKEPKGCI